MVRNKVALVIFEGGQPKSPIEEDMVRVRHAIVCDSVEKYRDLDNIDPIIVVTNYPQLRDRVHKMGAVVDFSQESFHFGKRLQMLIHAHKLEHVFYMGGASAPLLTAKEVGRFAQQLLDNDNMVLTNNVQSADLVGFTPALAIDRIQLPSADNALANLLRDAGLEKVLMPHSVGIHFDLDTPTDIMTLSIHPGVSSRVQGVIQSQQLRLDNLIAAKNWLAVPYADVALIGRIGSPLITQVNTYARSRLRVFSEERGMKSLGREAKGQVQSLLGYFIDTVGPRQFFAYLGQIAHVAFIDTRVLFAHNKRQLSDRDRFCSDLYMVDMIEDPWTRAFTQAALEAPLTVVLGGHSMVSGGLWALIDAILDEDKRAFSPHKLYQIEVAAQSPLAGRPLKQVLRSLPFILKCYGVTRPKDDGQGSFTHIAPPQDLIVEPGFSMHLAGPIIQIRQAMSKLGRCF